MCWLEFWVYMCSHGIKPMDNEYLAEPSAEEIEFAEKARKMAI